MIPQISPEEALQMLVDDDRAVLVDVRTKTEWEQVGVADPTASGRPTRYVSWNDEQGVVNVYFADQVTDGLDPDAPILLLCRSGARSQAGAELLAASGYTGAHNIAGGFEGPGGQGNGWKDRLGSATYHPGG